MGVLSELLRVFYEPGSERTLRIAASFEDALRRVDHEREAWSRALELVRSNAPREQVRLALGSVQTGYLRPTLLRDDEEDDPDDDGGR